MGKLTDNPNASQRAFAEALRDGRVCEGCGEDDCFEFECITLKANLVRSPLEKPQ